MDSRLLVLSLAFCAVASGCNERRGQTVTAFGEGIGRGVPELVQYFDDAGKALEKHLKSTNLSVAKQPANAIESGSSFAAQRDTWYEAAGRNVGLIHVKVRQPTENAAGLYVYVVWQAEGTPDYIASVQEDANALRAQLTEWWAEYQRRNPRGEKMGGRQ